MRRTPLWLVTALFVLLSLLLAACAAPAAPAPAPAPAEVAAPAEAPAAEAPAAPAPVTLEFWGGWTGPDGDIMLAMIQEYMAQNPHVTVNLTIQQWSPLFDTFIASASAGESPDILAMHPQELSQFVALDLIDPLEEIFADSAVINQEQLPASAWTANTYQGHLYGAPLDQHMHGLFYNKDLFEAAGLSGPPTTGDELLEMGKILTLDANGNHPGDEGFDPANIVQYAINMHTNHHAFFQWWSLYRQQGGELIAEDGNSCVMDIDKSVAAWTFLQDQVYTNYIAPQGQTDYPRDFLDGRTAMLIDGPWRIPALEQARTDTGFNWGSGSYPLVFEQKQVWGSEHTFTLPTLADPTKREAAVDLIEWLVSNSQAWAVSGQIPVFPAVLESDEFKALEGREAFANMLSWLVTLPNIPRYNEIFASNAPTPMMVMAQNIMLEQADPRAESEQACQTITAILSVP